MTPEQERGRQRERERLKELRAFDEANMSAEEREAVDQTRQSFEGLPDWEECLKPSFATWRLDQITSVFPLDLPHGVIKGFADDEKVDQLVAKARAGHEAAHQILEETAEALDLWGNPVPHSLDEYLDAGEFPAKKRSKKKVVNEPRNEKISLKINELVRGGFQPTRTKISRRQKGVIYPQSACSIVSKALEALGVQMDERTVEDFWAGHSQV